MIRFSSFDFDTRRAIAWGTTWALAVAICEALATSPERWASPQLLLWWLTYWAVPLWCAIGALLVWLLNRGDRRAGWGGMIFGFLILVPVPLFIGPPSCWFLMNVSERLFPSLTQYNDLIGVTARPDNWEAIGVYNLWVYLFYGSLLIAVYTLTVRTERFRSRLHASAMARSRTEGLLDAERLQALQAQIDPNLLLESMRELELRYRSDPESAERLLEALVEFLRFAMHGLREPVSTLEAELRLARAFTQLQRERNAAGSWRVSDEGFEGAKCYKFPSLLMLRLLALGGAGGRPLLRVRSEGASTVLQLFGLTESVADELLQQLRARLRTLYGGRFILNYSPATPTRLAIVLNHSLTEGEENA